MIISAVSIAWSFIQITLLCTLSLIVAWSLRGRRPQLVTAILAGACIASLFLAMISVVPGCQWSLALVEAPPSAKLPATPEIGLEANSSLTVRFPNTESLHHVSNDLKETSILLAPARPSSLVTIRQFISKYLHRVDREVRDAEVWQRPVAKVRNVSLLMFAVVGLGAMSLLWCSSWFYMRRILRCSQPVYDQGMLELISSQSRGFGLKRTPAIRESNLVPIGATVGWRQVTVLLHTDWREWSNAERTAVIAHELAHAIRHDFVWVIISSWTRILLFFHPMVHALVHRLRLEQELAADQLAAGKVGSAKVYGRALASLTLRSQQSFETSNARLGSMLSAGQICVTRRVIMLRQGSLKPIPTRSRWSILAVIAIACTAIPLTGLRGTTQEPDEKPTAASETPKQNESTELTNPKPLSKEFLAAYPPIELKGAMVYRPGRFRAGEFGPEAAWFQEWFSISAIGRPIPDLATIHGQCNNIVRWRDEERLHGSSSFAVSFNEGESTLPGQLTKLHDPANLGNDFRTRTVSTQKVGGRTISGVTQSSTSDEPEKWQIDDEQGYFLGSLEQAKQFVQGQRFALDSIPERFREDYQNAAFGMVYTDCATWPSKLEAFYKGSPRESELQILGFQPLLLLKDIKQIGLFVDGCKTPACSVRVDMQDARAAKRFATQMRTLIELGKVANTGLPADQDKTERELNSSILETMQVTESESEVRFEFDVFIPSLADGPISTFHSIDSWININSEAKSKGLGSISVSTDSTFSALPSLFGQTINAANYRGKTVLLELELQCDDEYANEAGAFVWASRHEPTSSAPFLGRKPQRQGSTYTGNRVLAAKTAAANGSALFSESMKANRRFQGIALSENAPCRTLRVLLSVPSDAEHISFGCYSKSSEVCVGKMKFLVTDEAEVKTRTPYHATDALDDVPYNILVIPGYRIGKEPSNLAFEKSNSEPTGESIRQAAQTSNTESR